MFFNWFRSKKCPNCNKQWSWDGYKCIRCGYIEKLSKKSPVLSSEIMDLFDPVTHSPQEIYCQKELIPENPGVYAWYFDTLFGNSFVSNTVPGFITIEIDSSHTREWFLLYIGIAGKREGRTLRDRIYGDHLNQNSAGSTLRQTLAALLWSEICLNPLKQLNGDNEKQKLNHWIFQHARVAWLKSDNPGKVEKLMIKEFGRYFHLNIQGNKNNPRRKELKQLRKNWRKAGK